MQRTNMPTIIAVAIAVVLAGILVWYAVKDNGGAGGPDKSDKTRDKEKFELVTKLGKPAEFLHADVPEGPKIDLSAVLRDPDGKEIKLSALVGERALVVFVDTELDRRLKAGTRGLNRVLLGGKELNFPVIVILPRGTSTSASENFARKRALRTPMFIDADGEFADINEWDIRTAALIDGDGTILRSFGPEEGWDDRFCFSPPITDDVLFWAWTIPQVGPEVDVAAKRASVKLVRAALTAKYKDDKIPAELASLVDAPALKGKPEHAVYVSLFRPGETKRLRGEDAEGTLGERLARATGRALGSAHDQDEWVAAAPEIRFVIDVAGPSFKVPGRELRTQWYFFEPGVDGAVVVNGGREGVVLPGETVTQGLMSPRVRKRDEKLPRMLSEACRRAGMASKAWETPSTDLRRFRTTSWGETIPGKPYVDLYRANVLIGEQDSQAILDYIQLAGRWLLGTVKEDGSFDYQYYPNTDEGSKDYSVVRHAGSVYGLFEMAELAREEPQLRVDLAGYMDAGSRSVGWVYDALGTPPEDKTGERYCLMEGSRCQSGSAALSLMTYMSRPPVEHIPNAKQRGMIYKADDQAKMDGLALTMTDMIDADGKVFQDYKQAMTMDAVKKEPMYYPGEVMLALTRYYIMTEDERWLEGAKAICENQMAMYSKDRWMNPDHWVMQALYLLFHVTGDARYAETALQMGTHFASEQYTGPHVAPFPDYVGSYRRSNDVPRTTRAGSRTEAMMGVVYAAWEMGVDARVYEDAVLAATRHMSEQLFRPETSYWMADQDRAMGALRMGVVDNHCRIDNNQHALVGMIGALEVARKREAVRKPTTTAGAATTPQGSEAAAP